MELGLWSAVAIILGFSFAVILLDSYVVRPWRERRLQARADAGDKEIQELLREARSANVVDE